MELHAAVYDKHSRKDWADAYAVQGLSDLRVYKVLDQAHQSGTVEFCHVLHYLQMATEKIGKAWLFRYSDTPMSELQTSHVVFKKFTVSWLRDRSVMATLQGKGSLVTSIKNLMADIERLAPAVDRDHHPVNVEYPWSTQHVLETPSKHDFKQRWSHSAATFHSLVEQLRDAAARCTV